MKVVQLVDRWSQGGVPRIITNIYGELIRNGHECCIIAIRETENQTIVEGGHSIQIKGLGASYLNLPAFFKKLYGFLNHFQPDIIHDHYGGLWALSYLIHPTWSKRAVYHVHNEFKVIETSPDDKRELRTGFFLRYIIQKFIRIVAISNHVKDTLVEVSAAVPSQIDVVPNSINPDLFIKTRSTNADIARKLGLHKYDLIMGTVGRFVYEKGFDLLVDILHAVRKQGINAAALLVGSGDKQYEAEVINSAKLLEIDTHCYFAGRQEMVVDYIRAMDCFLFCSRQEPFGITLLEAMACRVPIIAMRQQQGGGPDEFLINKYNALLGPYENTNALAEAVTRLYKSPVLKGQLIEGANATLYKYENGNMYGQLMVVYNQVESQQRNPNRKR